MWSSSLAAAFLLLASALGGCSGADRDLERPSSLVRGDRRQSPSRRASAARPREDEEKSPFASDRLGLGEASERARQEHTNAHSSEGLQVDGYGHPACAPLTPAQRRACPLLVVPWSSISTLAGGVELAAPPQGHLEQLQWMVTCHIAFGREHGRGACPLHVRGVSAATLIDRHGVRLRILTSEPSQVVELQQRVKRLVPARGRR